MMNETPRPDRSQQVVRWLSIGAALLAGVIVAYRESGEHLFERAMRSLDITGSVLVPLSLLFAAAVVFLAMVFVFAALSAAGQLVRSRLNPR